MGHEKKKRAPRATATATATGDGDHDGEGEDGHEQLFEDVSGETNKCFTMS